VLLLTFSLSDLCGDLASVLGRQAFAVITELEQLQETEREKRERERAKSVFYKHELLLLMLPGLPVVRSANNPIKENNGSPPADIPPPLANYTPLNMSPSARALSNRKHLQQSLSHNCKLCHIFPLLLKC